MWAQQHLLLLREEQVGHHLEVGDQLGGAVTVDVNVLLAVAQQGEEILQDLPHSLQTVIGLNGVSELTGRIPGRSEGLSEVGGGDKRDEEESCRVSDFDVVVSYQVHLHPLRQGAEQPGLGVSVPRHLDGEPVQGGLGAGLGQVPDPVHDQGGVAGQTSRATAQLRQQSQQAEEVEGVVGALHPEENHLGHLLGQAGVVAGQAEDEVAGLPDVDVVPGDVVEEQQRLPCRQAVDVLPTQVDAVVLPPGFLHQHRQQEDHLVQGRRPGRRHVSAGHGKCDDVVLAVIVVRHLQLGLVGGAAVTADLEVELHTDGDGLDVEQELRLLVAQLGEVEEEGEELCEMFEVGLGSPVLQQVEEGPDEPGDRRPRAYLGHGGGVWEIVRVHRLPG